MHITVEWDNESKETLIYTYYQGWSLGDVDQIFKQGREMMHSVEQQVDSIMDFHAAPIFPSYGALSSGMRLIKSPSPANAGITVLVGSPFVNNLLNTVLHLSPNSNWEMMAAKDVNEARAKLRAKRKYPHTSLY